MIRVPAAADIGLLRGLLSDLGDLRIVRRRLEKPIDVNFPHSLREGDMLLWRESLVTEKNHAVLVEGLSDVGDGFGVQALDKSMPKSSAPSAPEVGRTSDRVFRTAVPPMSKLISVWAEGIQSWSISLSILNRKHDSAVLLGNHLSAPPGDRRQRHRHEQALSRSRAGRR